MQNWIFDLRSRSTVLLTAAFLFVTFLVYSGITNDFDQSVITNIQLASGNLVLDTLMHYVTESGDVFFMLFFAIALIILKKTRRIGITLMIVLVITTILTGYIKCGVDRERPDLEFLGQEFPVSSSRDTFALFCQGSFGSSFPSGHASRAALFALVLGFALSERFPRGCYLLLLYPALVSITRVYLLHHYPMDVIGGVILGFLIAGILAKKTKLYQLFDRSKT